MPFSRECKFCFIAPVSVLCHGSASFPLADDERHAEVAIIEPYRRLVPRPGAAAADVKRTLLVTRSLSPLATLVSATLQRHFFVALMAAISVLAEALIVVLATIPFSPATLWRAYQPRCLRRHR